MNETGGGTCGPVIVAMDGSTNVSTAALLSGGPGAWTVLARRSDTDSRGQARVLLRLVDDMLTETGRAQADIAALAAGTGPGTFTGVRIAVATARALALALEIPVFGVSTLAGLAAQAVGSLLAAGNALPEATSVPEWIIPVVDARRGQVFYALYRRANDGSGYARADDLAVCDRADVWRSLPAGGEALIVGDTGLLEGEAGAGDTPRLLPVEVRAEHLVAGQQWLKEPGGDPGGVRLDAWLADALRGAVRVDGGRGTGEIGTPEAVRPIYVRSPDADIHITKMRDPWAEAGPRG